MAWFCNREAQFEMAQWNQVRSLIQHHPVEPMLDMSRRNQVSTITEGAAAYLAGVH